MNRFLDCYDVLGWHMGILIDDISAITTNYKGGIYFIKIIFKDGTKLSQLAYNNEDDMDKEYNRIIKFLNS